MKNGKSINHKGGDKINRKYRDLGRGKGYRNIIISDSKVLRNNRLGIKSPQRLPLRSLYCGTYGRKIADVDKVISKLKKGSLTEYRFTGNHVSFKFDGQRISNDIVYKKHEGNLGNWGHRLDDNRVFIDKDIPKRYLPQMAVHESVEQFASEKFGLKYAEAHALANYWEKKYADKHGIDWETSQKAILTTKN
jgi:hypothetical protein